MPKILTSFILVWALCLTQPVFAAKKTLTIAADLWCPINCEPDARELGIGVDLARKIFTRHGYEVNYIVMPWARALEEVRAGRIDAVVGGGPAREACRYPAPLS